MAGKNIIISQTDSLKEVILSIPLAGVLKELEPESRIIFLSPKHARPVVEASAFVDEFVDWDSLKGRSANLQHSVFSSLRASAIVHVSPNSRVAYLAFRSHIAQRVGFGTHWFNLLYCNHRPAFPLKKHSMHEVEINLRLLESFGARKEYSLSQIVSYFGFKNIPQLKPEYEKLLDTGRFNLIIHPKSSEPQREWGVANFSRLIEMLPGDEFQLFITGNRLEADLMQELLVENKDKIEDLTEKLDLEQQIAFIAAADGLIAGNTSALHIASVLGKYTVGLFPPIRPFHAGRWKPLGERAQFLVLNKECNDCRRNFECRCLKSIKPKDVKATLLKMKQGKAQ